MTGVYIIAEVGVNHNGSMKMAQDLIDLAADAGADAVKFQVFRAKELVCGKTPKACYQEKTTPPDETQLEMLNKLQLSQQQLKDLCEYCQFRKIDFIASPFDNGSVDFMMSALKFTVIKIASGEITNVPLLLRAARTDQNIILSTGMSTLGEVENVLMVLAFGYTAGERQPSQDAFLSSYSTPESQAALKEKVTLLHCTSEYPAPLEDVNLLAMDTLRRAFGLKVGYSDHTPGISIAIAAAARGAAVIEKHFTLDKGLPGPDHQASLEPYELYAMVKAIRQVELALGIPIKTVTPSELSNRSIVRKSLVAAQAISKGATFTADNIGIKRPGTGISPSSYWDILGKKAVRDYETDDLVEL